MFSAAQTQKCCAGHVPTRFTPTFQEGVSRHGEERQLQESLAVDERLEPLGGLQHQGVSEGGRVPLQQLRQLRGQNGGVTRAVSRARRTGSPRGLVCTGLRSASCTGTGTPFLRSQSDEPSR